MTHESRFDPWTSHQVITISDESVGLRAVIALDDLRLGPGFGGVRMRPYSDAYAAIDEAQRLARAMTFKHALAELPYGGAKSVIVDDGRARDADARRALFERFGDAVAATGGRYIPGVDMFTTLADMAVIRSRGATVYCADADPSPWTARGVFAAMKAGAAGVLQASSLDGLVVAVQGVGSVGADLARLAAADGARLVVADIDPQRAATVAEEVGGSVASVEQVATTACDIFAPCAVARVITPSVIPALSCRLIVGAANDTLDSPECDELLRERGITFVPDYVANAGGVIHEHARALAWAQADLERAVEAIGRRVTGLIEEAGPGGSLVGAALERGRRRLRAAHD
ncbi:Glu/Leu/Phe/Val dehydrogenase [Gephyromycinifex aptenodytis]|uniref:Glu/Leu/Phe/Val dehydrogenase n=1 Tax=Gephyromycinifex aptenodytis TaxID=2716227 RepID=UPI0014472E84|nr:Glu/Leu/Phe/Val dehydrogenase [Gephyromycinifex aptenodytis]